MHRIAAALALVVATAGVASAQGINSQYTSTATKACKLIKHEDREGGWSIWQCPGVSGFVVRMTDDDACLAIAIGQNLADAEKQPAAKHQFAPMNNVFDTLEWRIAGGKPFATIQRWRLSDPEKFDKTGRPVQAIMLVVTRIAPACHVAYVDANANPNANVLAREVADKQARSFDCKNPAMIVGKRGRAIELATP